jgi:hypothetical protein
MERKMTRASSAIEQIRAIYEEANERSVAVLAKMPSEKERIIAEKMLASIGIVIRPTDADEAGELVDAPQDK